MTNLSAKTAVDGYYSRHDPKKNYEELLARAGFRIQSAETNDMQKGFNYKIKRLADVLFKDGDVTRDAQVSVDSKTGTTQAGEGDIYLKGGIRRLEAASFQIPLVGVVNIGVYCTEKVISELEDPTLRNPAVGTRGEGEPGAWRLQMNFAWGFFGDGSEGEFFPVYKVEDGHLQAKEAPPNLDSFNQALARYDRDSTGGGTYISDGLIVRAAEATGVGVQSYTVSEGRARVYGCGIELPTSRRILFDAKPDMRFVDTEVHTAEGSVTQRIDIAHPPLAAVTQLRVTKRKTVFVVHGSYAGVVDPLPDASVVTLVSVKQGDTVFVSGTDYKKFGDSVDWSPLGNEPSAGSTYECTYDHIVAVTPKAQDYDGFSVDDAVQGSSVIVSYNQALPRIDRLCLTQDGSFTWLKGISAEYNARGATPAAGVLALASVYQYWRGDSGVVVNDGVRVISFATLEAVMKRLDYAMTEIARQRLESDVSTRESGARVGIFVDPLMNDSMRDQGLVQSAAVVNGELILPITPSIKVFDNPGTVAIPAYTPVPVLSQPLRTGEMKVNPYMAFAVLPARVTMTPSIDQWTQVETKWTSPITERFNIWVYAPHDPRHGQTISNSSSNSQTVDSTTQKLEYLRQIPVGFSIEGFGPGEILKSIIFDGIAAEFTAEPADDKGNLIGTYTIPPKIPAGAKDVVFSGGEGGTSGSAVFVGQGQLTVQTLRQVTTVTNYIIDPLAQTFVLEKTTQVCGVDLWFTKKSGQVRVQIRDVQSGFPTRTVLAESVLEPDQIVVTGGGHTRATFSVPVQLQAGSEYAVVILCNDPETAVRIAEMNQYDSLNQTWVSAQAYTVGVLLSSSNALTWTAHQDKDLTFRLLEASFAAGATHIQLGSAEVSAATDLVVFAVDERPAATTQVEYVLETPDGTTYTIDHSQPVRLAAPITGAINVSARLKGTAQAAPLLWPGVELLSGTVGQSADYFSRSITAFNATKAILVYDAVIPSGATVTPTIQIDSGEWQELTSNSAVPQGDGLVEYSFSAPLTAANLVKLKITLGGNTQARPSVRNIRFMAIQ